MSMSAKNLRSALNNLGMLHLLVFTSLLILIGWGNGQETPRGRGVPSGSLERPIAYISHPNAGRAASRWERELMVVDAASGKTWQLTSNRADDQAPVWSPSGTHLMYLSRPVSMTPGMRNQGEYRLMVHELMSGRNRQIDLSWVKKSEVASPQNGIITNWLGCAAWSPVDSTQVAVGVMVKGPLADVEKFVEMEMDELRKAMQEKHRIVLIDLEERTVRLVAENEDRCSGISWSPNGDFLLVNSGNDFDYLDVDTGEKRSVRGEHTVSGKSLSYSVTDWTPNTLSLLVRGYLLEPDTLVAYRYDLESEMWSKPLGRFGGRQYVLEYAPPEDNNANVEDLDLVLLRSEKDSFYDDLWLYQRPEGTFKRLTEDRMPKMQDVASYQGR